MRCINCGNQVPDGAKFCNNCGSRLPEADPVSSGYTAQTAGETTVLSDIPVAPEAPVRPTPQPPTYQPPIRQVPPVQQNPGYGQSSFRQAPPAQPNPGYQAPPTQPNPGYGQPPVYQAPPAPAKQPRQKKSGRKGGKIALILIPIILVIALVAVAAVFFVGKNNKYDQAVTLLEERSYDEALALFRELGDYKDSADQAASLEEQQSQYDDAHALMDGHNYEEAKEIFASLGNYRDSETMADSEVNYQQALYIMSMAQESADDQEAVGFYMTAALYLSEDLSYKDSAEKYSECYYYCALAYMAYEQWDEALVQMESMNETHADAFYEAYMGMCADSTILENLEASLQMRADLSSDEEATYQQMLDVEYDFLIQYETMHFHDTELQELFFDYLDGLNVQQSALDYDGYLIDQLAWYEGAAMRFDAVKELCDRYGFLSDNAQLYENVYGASELYRACAAAEEAVYNQLVGVVAEYSDELGYYLVFENPLEYSFDLYIYLEFYNGDTYVDYYGWELFPVEEGGTTYVLIWFPDDSVAWDTWYIYWDYTNFAKDGVLLNGQ